MRFFSFFLSFLTINFVQAQSSPAVITGTLKNSSNPDVFVSVPVNGGFFGGAAQHFSVDTITGIYKIKLGINKPTFIEINNNWHTVKLYVEPGKNYIWNTVFNKNENIDEFQGYQSGVNTLLNTVSATPESRMVDIGLGQAHTSDKKREILQNHLNEKIAPVQKLLKEGKVSNRFYKDFLNEMNVWGKDVLGTHYYFEFRNTDDGNNKEKTAEFNKNHLPDWDKLYMPVNDSLQWQMATSYNSFMRRYPAYREIKEKGQIIFNDDYFRKEWNYLNTNLKGRAKEFVLATLIYDLYGKNEYDEQIIGAYDEFKKMYPKSPLLTYLKDPVNEVVTYHENFGKDHPEVKFVDIPAKDTIAADFFKSLKNNKISYIDMWATWCLPCRMELKYAIPLHPEFEKIGVNIVYLSFDEQQSKSAWERMVKSLALKGTNMLAPKELQNDLYKSLKNFNGIPRYVILSPDGDVLEENANRPTDNMGLLKQLKQYADSYNKK